MSNDLPGFSRPNRKLHERTGGVFSGAALLLGIAGIVASIVPPLSLVFVALGVTFGLLALRYPERNRAAIGLICCGFALLFSGIASIFYYRQFIEKQSSAEVASRLGVPSTYFYDLTNGELVVAPITWGASPVNNHYINGYPAGFEAKIFSCGDCSDLKQRQIAYLQVYAAKDTPLPTPPAGATTMPADPAPPTSQPGYTQGTQYAMFVMDGKIQGGWHDMSSNEGGQIVANAHAPCPGGVASPTPCSP